MGPPRFGPFLRGFVTDDSDPPISLLDTLKLAIAEFDTHENDRAAFDSQIRNLAWLLITISTVTFLGLKTPPMQGAYICLAVLNWVATAGVAIAVVISAIYTARVFLSRKYVAPPSIAATRLWERALREHATGSDDSEQSAIPMANQKAMGNLLSTYAVCAARNAEVNGVRFGQLSKARKFLVIAVACFAVEASATVSIHFMESYYDNQPRPKEPATSTTSTAAYQ